MNIETRKRRANLWFTAAIVCMPVLLLVAVAAIAPSYVAYEDPGVGWKDVGIGVLLLVGALVVGLGIALFQGFWRNPSSGLPYFFGFVAGIAGSLVPAGMLEVLVGTTSFIGMGMLVFAVLGIVLPGVFVARGRLTQWEPIDDELIDSDLDVVVRGRDKVGLSIDATSLTLKSRVRRLSEDLRDVESVTVTKSLNEQRRDVTGDDDQMRVSPGAAVRIRLVRGEWYVPVDAAEAVARLITRRHERAVAENPEDGPVERGDDGEITIRARRDRKLRLTIDGDQLTMAGDRPGEHVYGFADLEEIESVEVTTIDTEERRDVTGQDDQVLVTPGEALLITVDGGRWLFPVDKAEQVAAVITARLERYRREEEWFDWPARDEIAATLSLDDSSVCLSGTLGDTEIDTTVDLGELTSVTVIELAERTYDLTGRGNHEPVTAGEALQLRFDDASEWIFPVDNAQNDNAQNDNAQNDNAQDIATKITERAAYYRRSLAAEDVDQLG